MASITLKGNPIQTMGTLPAVGSKAPDSTLVNVALENVKLSSFEGKKVLNIFPSIDTPVCALSVKAFNEKAGSMKGVTVLNISADLPFAHKRACAAANLEGVKPLSCFRTDFAKEYSVMIKDGPLAGLCSRAVIILGPDNKVIYTEQVPEIAQEPNYEAALKALR